MGGIRESLLSVAFAFNCVFFENLPKLVERLRSSISDSSLNSFFGRGGMMLTKIKGSKQAQLEGKQNSFSLQ
jgi:hypothetical protein